MILFHIYLLLINHWKINLKITLHKLHMCLCHMVDLNDCEILICNVLELFLIHPKLLIFILKMDQIILNSVAC